MPCRRPYFFAIFLFAIFGAVFFTVLVFTLAVFFLVVIALPPYGEQPTMMSVVRPASIGARVVDSLPFSQAATAKQAEALRADGVDCLVGYLGVINVDRLALLLAAGLAFMPVTLADRFDGPAAARQCLALGLPAGTTVWLDVEGTAAFNTPPAELIAIVNAWADAVAAAGYMPGLYVGVPQPLTSAELFALRVVRYWRGQGSIRDRFNALAEPACGWTMVQAYPQHVRAGVLVDDDLIQEDFRGRLPAWAVAPSGAA